MAMEIVTKEDLDVFRKQLLADIQLLVKESASIKPADSLLEGLKTAHVRKILGCSTNTLMMLRIKRKIRTKKIGGTLYYNKEDVRKLVEEGFS